MREIKFRGKNYKGQWEIAKNIYIEEDGKVYFLKFVGIGTYFEDEIDKKTIGQFVGIQDMRGVDIYEGDILQLFCPWFDQSRTVIGIVFYKGTEWLIKGNGFTRDLSGIETDDGWNSTGSIEIKYKVIGNIHDAPEFIPEGFEP